MKITLILALRYQHELFLNLLYSLIKTTFNKNGIEMIVIIDDDDNETNKLIPQYLDFTHGKIHLKFMITKKSDFFIKDYYNIATREARGRWIMTINADSQFVTTGWELYLNDTMSAYASHFQDDILYGIVDDSHGNINNNFSCWPLCSKEYANLMGGIMDDRIPIWGADVALGQVFDLVDGGQRKIKIPQIKIEHLNHHVDKSIPEAPHVQRFHKLVAKYPAFLTPEQIQESADKVNQYLKDKHEENISQ